jgi:hypothetical protein
MFLPIEKIILAMSRTYTCVGSPDNPSFETLRNTQWLIVLVKRALRVFVSDIAFNQCGLEIFSRHNHRRY